MDVSCVVPERLRRGLGPRFVCLLDLPVPAGRGDYRHSWVLEKRKSFLIFLFYRRYFRLKIFFPVSNRFRISTHTQSYWCFPSRRRGSRTSSSPVLCLASALTYGGDRTWYVVPGEPKERDTSFDVLNLILLFAQLSQVVGFK